MPQRQIREIIAELDKFTSFKIRQLASEISSELTENTPVDLGWARANWVANLNSPVVNTESLSKEDRKAKLNAQRARQSTAIVRIITTYTVNQGEIFISNGVPYILRLNEGSSKQAPRNFIQDAIRDAVKTVQRLP